MKPTTWKDNAAETFDELARAARTYLDQEAIYHQDFAGNCIEQPSDACLSDGLGGERFDCSGFVIAALQKSTGNVHEFAGLRHVRDMWQAAREQSQYHRTSLAVGALVVIRRCYTIKGTPATVPGHIGVVSDIDHGIVMIHANPRTGRVEESLVRNQGSIMGYIAAMNC